jgi:LemA protein
MCIEPYHVSGGIHRETGSQRAAKQEPAERMVGTSFFVPTIELRTFDAGTGRRNEMGIAWLVTLALVVAVIIYLTAVYNRMVTLKNRYKNAFAQIDVQLKRRHDLIPNLVETAKGYIKHERETLEAVTRARNAAAGGLASALTDPGNASAILALGQAESNLVGALGQFLALKEAYPDLKANQNMIQLSEELTSTENKVAFARQAFNDQVMGYNTYRQSFPQRLLTGVFGHAADAALLEFEDRAQIITPPHVSF